MNEPNVERLRQVMIARSLDARPTDDCPDAELLWSAVVGDLPKASARELGLHAVGCPACAEAWRLARDLSMEALGNERTVAVAGPAPLLRWGLAAAAVIVIALIVVPWMNRDSAPVFRTQDVTDLRSLVQEDTRLSRDDFILSWEGPEGARYTVQVATGDLRVLDRSAELSVAEYRVDAARLAALPNGARVVWQVRTRLPDGTRLTPLTVTTIVDE